MSVSDFTISCLYVEQYMSICLNCKFISRGQGRMHALEFVYVIRIHIFVWECVGLCLFLFWPHRNIIHVSHLKRSWADRPCACFPILIILSPPFFVLVSNGGSLVCCSSGKVIADQIYSKQNITIKKKDQKSKSIPRNRCSPKCLFTETTRREQRTYI